jgi:hypothetical protein
MRGPPAKRRRVAERPRDAGSARGRPKQRALLAAIAVLLLLGGARAVLTLWRNGRTAAPRPAPAVADRAAGMSMIEAATEAARLNGAGRAYESLPYYRRVAPEIPPARLDFGLEFATALQLASLQASARSEVRVRLMRECLDELARTERAVRRPRDRARVIVARAFFLRIWGFPTDAVAELHRALETDPSYPDLVATTHLMEQRLRDPTLPLDERTLPGLSY